MLGIKAVKSVMQKARRRISAFQKAIKNKKLDKNKTTSYNDFQEFLKNSDKKFRRYNRKIGAYEPITPRGKLRNSEEFTNFVLDINEYTNTSRTAQEEIERQTIQERYRLDNDDMDELERLGAELTIQNQTLSDTVEMKMLHFDKAVDKIMGDKNPYEDLSDDAKLKLTNLYNNIDNYNIREVYDGVYNIINNDLWGGVFNEI